MSLLPLFLRSYGAMTTTNTESSCSLAHSHSSFQKTHKSQVHPNNSGNHSQVYFVSSLSFLRKQLFLGPEVSRDHISYKLQKILKPPFFPKVDPQRTNGSDRKQFVLLFLRFPCFIIPRYWCFRVPVSPDLQTTLRMF